jgi:hypothetical protein
MKETSKQKLKREKRLKKKGETRHHIKYGEDEIVVLLPSKGSHLVLTSFQSMGATKRNIKYLKDYRKALNYIIKEKENLCHNKNNGKI